VKEAALLGLGDGGEEDIGEGRSSCDVVCTGVWIVKTMRGRTDARGSPR